MTWIATFGSLKSCLFYFPLLAAGKKIVLLFPAGCGSLKSIFFESLLLAAARKVCRFISRWQQQAEKFPFLSPADVGGLKRELLYFQREESNERHAKATQISDFSNHKDCRTFLDIRDV